MVKETNAGQASVVGEASSSRQKRPRLPSTIEDEVERVEEEQGGNGGGTASVNRNVDGDEVITTTEVRSGTLFNLNLLDCPICCHALTSDIFQCDNGHIACSSCCTKLRNKCPFCTFPIGNYRCRAMERIVEAIMVPCPNAKHGCTEKLSYGKELVHVKECSFSLCYCPAPNCNYSGVYKDIYSHYDANHRNIWHQFICGCSRSACVRISGGSLVLQERRGGPLVVVQSFKEPQGVYVTVNCIAPSAPGVGKFSYDLTYSIGVNSMTFGSREMNRVQKVSFQTPEKDFMLIPHYFQSHCGYDVLKTLEIRIQRPAEEEEEDEEEEEEEEEDEEEEEEEDEEEEEEEEEEDEEEEEAEEHDEIVRRSTREKKANSKYQDKVK
ncbi:hypothetical protein EUTSA_v10018712mg [Eutrema salsugineum]|uniref:RING-type E3 ubiquitin transferase n=1 Tax=Eutrema salsugineum TaxID=72664 RepID=V4MBW8_EUTSA|nr:E3 ubiquitin-protein ligase SINA-like 2 [Eutrema salsugineum]ESQ28691.1 hypothetical protein EUTSA_v10018712mg [Eutrema salsugineum]